MVKLSESQLEEQKKSIGLKLVKIKQALQLHVILFIDVQFV